MCKGSAFKIVAAVFISTTRYAGWPVDLSFTSSSVTVGSWNLGLHEPLLLSTILKRVILSGITSIYASNIHYSANSAKAELYDWCCLSVCLSVCQSFVLSVSMITAKVSSRFILCYDSAYQSEELINFWWWSGPGFRITFPLPSPLQKMGF